MAAGQPPVRAEKPESAFASNTIDLGIVVGNVEKSVKFYTEAIGFTEITGFKVPGAFAADAGLSDGKDQLDIHVLVLGETEGATKLKLMEFPARQVKKGDSEAINSQLGFRYLTIYVADAGAAAERLKKAGVKLLGKTPVGLPAGLPQDLALLVFRDPDGNIVELVGKK